MLLRVLQTWDKALSIRAKLWLGAGAMFAFVLAGTGGMVAVLFFVNQEIGRIVQRDTPLALHSSRLESEVNRAEAALGFYLLSKLPVHQTQYQAALQAVHTELAALRTLEAQAPDPLVRAWLNTIADKMREFAQYESTFEQIAHDDLQNFPGMRYAAEHLNPLSREMMQVLSNMVSDEIADQQRADVVHRLHTLRYNWLTIDNEMRAYLGYRTDQALAGIDLYVTALRRDLEQFKTDYGADLSLVHEEGLAQAATILDQALTVWKNVHELHGGEQWRQDAYLLRSAIEPLSGAVQQAVSALVAHQRTHLAEVEQTVLRMGAAIMGLALVILAGAVLFGGISTVFMVRAIVRPLQGVVGIARQIADGDLGVTVDTHGSRETAQVMRALQDMVRRLAGLIAQIQHSSLQISHASEHIATTSRQQEATVTEQAATAKQVIATSCAIKDSAAVLLHTIKAVTLTAENTAHNAAKGHQELEAMDISMRHMLKAADSINQKLAVVKEKAKTIGNVVFTINKIADQTNLLSLNAAIEAEKAGEYGLGFSVVAKEIRRLADQTATATWDIEQIIKEMQSAVSGSANEMDTFSQKITYDVKNIYSVSSKLAEIIRQMQDLIPNFTKIRDDMQAQSESAEEISAVISELGESTHHTADSLVHSNSAIQELKQVAQVLLGSVSLFKLQPGGE